mmetsp:Transcript_26342/g.48069  ORF Transcript_26342/g.48069 Transcript_26342/m.48069 type:complete len:190 (+) Transcript_26342:1-570(+)
MKATCDEPQFASPPPPSSSWPSQGRVELLDLKVRYREGLPLVVKGVSCAMQAGSKVGVVGRTGSGKSSLLLALGRMNEVCGGKVLIDGVDASSIPLHALRKAIAVIPQEPHLFSGSVRFNLDPCGEFSDASIWSALEACRLKDLVMLGTVSSASSSSSSSGGGQGGAVAAVSSKATATAIAAGGGGVGG